MIAEQQAAAIRRAAEISVDHISAWFGSGTGHSMFQSMREEIERNVTAGLKPSADHIAELERKLKKLTYHLRDLEEKQKGYTQFAAVTGQASAIHTQTIQNLEKDNALLTIKLTSLTETLHITEERLRQLEGKQKGYGHFSFVTDDKRILQLETQLREHVEQNNLLVAAHSRLLQASLRLGDRNNVMAALLDRVPHASSTDPGPGCPTAITYYGGTGTCIACERDKMKEAK